MKSANVSRIERGYYVTYIFFGSSLKKIKLCQVSSLWDMCDKFYGGGFLLPPLPPDLRAAPKRSILNRVEEAFLKIYQPPPLLFTCEIFEYFKTAFWEHLASVMSFLSSWVNLLG